MGHCFVLSVYVCPALNVNGWKFILGHKIVSVNMSLEIFEEPSFKKKIVEYLNHRLIKICQKFGLGQIKFVKFNGPYNLKFDWAWFMNISSGVDLCLLYGCLYIFEQYKFSFSINLWIQGIFYYVNCNICPLDIYFYCQNSNIFRDCVCCK